MEKLIKESLNNMNALVKDGKLIEAGERYYASNIKTIEYDGSITQGKSAAMKKLTDFVASIQKVNEITLLRSASCENTSFSEYILNIDMKDGSNVYLHEIVRSLWENDMVIEERYFKG